MPETTHDATTDDAAGATAGYDVGPAEPRWTHVALRVPDIEAMIAWYREFTPLELIDQREDDMGYGAWLGMPGATNNPAVACCCFSCPTASCRSSSSRTTILPEKLCERCTSTSAATMPVSPTPYQSNT